MLKQGISNRLVEDVKTRHKNVCAKRSSIHVTVAVRGSKTSVFNSHTAQHRHPPPPPPTCRFVGRFTTVVHLIPGFDITRQPGVGALSKALLFVQILKDVTVQLSLIILYFPISPNTKRIKRELIKLVWVLHI